MQVALPLSLRLAICGVLLTGCTPPTSQWSPAESPKELRVETGRRLLALAFQPGRAELSAREQARLQAFVATGAIQPPDRVTLLAGSAEGGLGARRRDQVARLLRSQGVGAVVTAALGPTAGPNQATLVVEHAVVRLPDCPDWSKQPVDYTGGVASNFGCADTTDLGLMVADPSDLEGGRGVGSADGTLAAAAVARYRSPLAQAALPTETASSGAAGSGGQP